MRKLPFFLPVSVFVVIALTSAPALGNSYYVPDDFPTIQAAIDGVQEGDTVILRDGTYTGSGNKSIYFNRRTLTVRSESGAENCIIDLECSGRGFIFYLNAASGSRIEGLTITNGIASDWGAGVWCNNSSPTISHCIISNNHAADTGGGIWCWNSSPVISNCIIRDNSSGNYGGGIACDGSSPIMANCIVVGNMSQIGAGIDCQHSSSPMITNCTISNNTSDFYGGGIHCYNSFTTIKNSILWGNSALDGPELAIRNGTSLAVNCSDVKGGQAAVFVGTACTLNWMDGNIDADPLFIMPGYRLGDDWIVGDYRVYSCAPTIDAGNPSSDYSNEPDPNGARVNMGAYGNTPEAATLSFDTSWLAVVPDISGNGVPELALPRLNWTVRTVVGEVVDLLTGQSVKRVWFSGEYKPLALSVIPDLNANGSSELALLSVHPTDGKVITQIKDACTGVLVRNVWFSDAYTPLDLKIVLDLNSNGYPELAVLSTDWVTGKVVMQVKDSFTGMLVKNIWFSNVYAPMTFEVVDDLNSNGVPELAVLSTDRSSGKVVVQVKDLSTGTLVKNVWFSNVYAPMALEVVDDLNSNGVPELAVLSTDWSTGKVVVQVKDLSTGMLVKNVWFSDAYAALALKIVLDLNSNETPELAVLSTNRNTGKVLVQIKDSSTGLLVNNVWFSDKYAPIAFEAVSDFNSNGASEQAVLSVNSSTGKVVVQNKDSATGLLIKNLWF